MAIDLVKIAGDLHERFVKEQDRVDRIDKYLRGDHDKPYTPTNATSEYKLLQERSVSNWLPLIVDVMAQVLYVEGYRRSNDPENAQSWDELWQPNGLDSRQSAVHRAALGYGICYVTVLPGDPVPVIRGVSPRRMIAVYEDPAEDLWPRYALRVDTLPDGHVRLRLYDDTTVHTFTSDTVGGTPSVDGEPKEHGAGVCPVIRFADCIDLDGRARGQVEPLIPLQNRINQTAFDLLIAQTYGSFKVRTIAGLATPLDAAGNPISTIELSIKRFLTSEDPDTKFGQLDESSLSGYIESLDLSVRHLAAISQTPPHHLLGQMANLSAEALVAAESGRERKSEEHRHVFGEAWEQTIRLGAHLAGDAEGAGDESAQVVWRDSEARSLSQTADALGKIATQLGVPVQALWEKLPGVTLTDVERWKTMAKEGDALAQLTALLDRQAQTGPQPAPPVKPQPVPVLAR
jgi:hypothetical protein